MPQSYLDAGRRILPLDAPPEMRVQALASCLQVCAAMLELEARVHRENQEPGKAEPNEKQATLARRLILEVDELAKADLERQA